MKRRIAREVGTEEEERIARWVERAVIGLDLCPFAAAVWRGGRVRTAISDATTPGQAVEAALREAAELLDSSEISTTLVVFPRALADFGTFLDAVAAAEEALAAAGAQGVLQIATFHPEYVFEGALADDLSNYTNRAPFPVMHLLRETEVADAVDQHPDPEGIPVKNIERLEELGREAIEALLEDPSD